MPHAAMSANNVAVITGGASGIGLAAAMRFAGLGMKVCIADIGAARLHEAATKLSSVVKGGDADVMTAEVDVVSFDQVAALAATVEKRFGGTDILMNNAGIGPDSNSFGPLENWQRILAVNLWGIIHGTQAFAPHMIERGRPGLIINTGSKQGITTPPGNPAYNVSKAGKTFRGREPDTGSASGNHGNVAGRHGRMGHGCSSEQISGAFSIPYLHTDHARTSMGALRFRVFLNRLVGFTIPSNRYKGVDITTSDFDRFQGSADMAVTQAISITRHPYADGSCKKMLIWIKTG